MRERPLNEDDGGISMQSVMQGVRVAGALLGMLAIILGLVYATRVFDLVLNTLFDPAAFGVHLDKWVEALGGEQLDLTLGDQTFRGSRYTAVTILGSGVVILTWIALGFIIAGAKVISWTLSDREAVKKLLVHAFGSTRKPQAGKKP